MTVIGDPLNRVDGRLKVTGAAKYTAEVQIRNLAHAVMLCSTIGRGRVVRMDTSQAEHAPGVVGIMTPWNAAKLAGAEDRLTTLQNDKVFYNGQPIAVVIAEELHLAQHAASLVRVQYQAEPPQLDFEGGFPTAFPGHSFQPADTSWGDVEAGLAQADVKIDQVYTTPIQHHNSIETHATVSQWEGDHLTIYDTSQDIFGYRAELASILGIPEKNIRVLAQFVGGGFGNKGITWSHMILSPMAAKHVNRPVRLVVDRQQMFGTVGSRPKTHQRLVLGATRDGKMTAIRHQVYAYTSAYDEYMESSAFATRSMYACPNLETTHRLVPLNLGTPCPTRAPGVATGTFALEVGLDELAYELKIDPVQLRLANYTEVDPRLKLKFSQKALRECYLRGAEQFGWSKRPFEPRSMRDGSRLIGWGMGTETYRGTRFPTGAVVRLQADGRVSAGSGTGELGNGMYTIMTQVVSDLYAMAPDLIDARLGDTNLPPAPLLAGSRSTASVLPAVQAAAIDARAKLLNLAVEDPESPVHGAAVDDVDFKNGKIFLKSAPDKSEAFTRLLSRHGSQPIEGNAKVALSREVEQQYSIYSFGAVFAEVSVDPELGNVRVPRIVAVYDVGKVINEKTANSQFVGGIIWGVSLALHEDTYVDERTGRILNANLGEYRVPLNSDIGEIKVSATDIPDPVINPLGARGIGEIGVTGTGAAVANAIFHATGKRFRDLPITPEKLI